MSLTKRWVITVGVIVSVSVIATVCLSRYSTKNRVALPTGSSPATRVEGMGLPRSANGSARVDDNAAMSKNTATAVSYKKSLSQSKDYWVLAHQLLSAARAGDADAQFYLWKTMDFCSENNSLFQSRRGQPITLDEGLQQAAKLGVSMNRAQSIFERCHTFQEQDAAELGNAMDWLARATEAGQPIAQATTAEKLVFQLQLRSYLQAGAAQTPENTAPLIGNGADPRDLMRAAVESRDPEALFAIGMTQDMLNPGASDSTVNQLAWSLVACQRGLDCSAEAGWYLATCVQVFCGIGTPTDMIMGAAGNTWPVVEQRAQEINAKLDSGQWGALGLGS